MNKYTRSYIEEFSKVAVVGMETGAGVSAPAYKVPGAGQANLYANHGMQWNGADKPATPLTASSPKTFSNTADVFASHGKQYNGLDKPSTDLPKPTPPTAPATPNPVVPTPGESSATSFITPEAPAAPTPPSGSPPAVSYSMARPRPLPFGIDHSQGSTTEWKGPHSWEPGGNGQAAWDDPNHPNLHNWAERAPHNSAGQVSTPAVDAARSTAQADTSGNNYQGYLNNNSGITNRQGNSSAGSFSTPYGNVSYSPNTQPNEARLTTQRASAPQANMDGTPNPTGQSGQQFLQSNANSMLSHGMINPGSQAQVTNKDLMSSAAPNFGADFKNMQSPNYNRPSILDPRDSSSVANAPAPGLPLETGGLAKLNNTPNMPAAPHSMLASPPAPATPSSVNIAGLNSQSKPMDSMMGSNSGSGPGAQFSAPAPSGSPPVPQIASGSTPSMLGKPPDAAATSMLPTGARANGAANS